MALAHRQPLLFPFMFKTQEKQNRKQGTEGVEYMTSEASNDKTLIDPSTSKALSAEINSHNYTGINQSNIQTNKQKQLGLVLHVFNPITREAEAVILRTVWSAE